MAKITQDELELLVTKAALDPAFRDQLKSAPRDAVTMSDVVRTSIEVDEDELDVLATLASDLERFGRAPLDPIDAKTWANGLCYLRH